MQRDLLADPVSRKLRIFAFDPGVSAQFDTASIGEITIAIPWERDLQPGPVGEYLEVVDADPGDLSGMIALLFATLSFGDGGRDIVLTVNGAKVTSAQDTLTRIANIKPGAKVKITGLRGPEKFSTEVEVTERPRNR